MELHEHFSDSAYTLHRTALRRERLPQCCRNSLGETGRSVKFLTRQGTPVWLPVWQCAECGKQFARWEGKYLPIRHPMQYEWKQ